jgi:hypothetical protein
LRRKLLMSVAGAAGVLAPLALGADGSASAMAPAYEVIDGCIDWNVQQGCVMYLGCFVYSNGTYVCIYHRSAW